MGCGQSRSQINQIENPERQVDLAQKPNESGGPKSYLVPFGHVPYCPSLPGAMGPLWEFPIEWWYYVGWAQSDVPNSKPFTILIELLRDTIFSVLLYGIGNSTEKFVTNSHIVEGQYPTPTSTSWSVSGQDSDANSMLCTLNSGILGLPGATYSVEMNDKENKVGASLVLKDTFGMIFETTINDAIPSKSSSCTYEFAMPSLMIEPGSTILVDGEEQTLTGGNIWLDRQVIGKDGVGRGHGGALYYGNWLAVVMDDLIYMLAFFWPSKNPQWIVGDELVPPILPTGQIGLKYPRLNEWQGVSPIVGVTVLDSKEFDLNILDPKDPDNSPHWKSPISGQTYCSAWKLMLEGGAYVMNALVPGSEVGLLKNRFFEGAATIHDRNGQLRGHAFVEQMGYN